MFLPPSPHLCVCLFVVKGVIEDGKDEYAPGEQVNLRKHTDDPKFVFNHTFSEEIKGRLRAAEASGTNVWKERAPPVPLEYDAGECV